MQKGSSWPGHQPDAALLPLLLLSLLQPPPQPPTDGSHLLQRRLPRVVWHHCKPGNRRPGASGVEDGRLTRMFEAGIGGKMSLTSRG